MLNAQSVFEYLFRDMKVLLVLHVSKVWKEIKFGYFIFLHSSTLENLLMKTVIFVAAQHFRLDIEYGINDLRSLLSLTGLKCV
jgi:hypothetical protein